jgi:3-oxoacyl-[acyl-carrier protein] reductase
MTACEELIMSAVRSDIASDTQPSAVSWAGASYPDLAGQVAVITGGSRGIGAATARAFAANGMAVAVVGRDEAAIAATVDSIRPLGQPAVGVRADCTVEADVHRLAAEVAERLGPVAVVAAFAGGDGRPAPTAKETAAHWRDVVDNELTSTFLTISAFLPVMLNRRSGAIITMSSAAARQAARSSAAYAAAKAGIIAFTRHLASEVAHDHVRVNCLAPSAIENDKMRAWVPAGQRAELGASFPLGRLGQPEDVAAAALFLASASASWVTGVTLDIAGGKIMV